MNISNYIKKGKKFENMNEKEMLSDAEYLKWMNEINYYFDVNLKKHPLKESINKCYFFLEVHRQRIVTKKLWEF